MTTFAASPDSGQERFKVAREFRFEDMEGGHFALR